MKYITVELIVTVG